MSNHATARTINLHHKQVNEGRLRKQQRREYRLIRYLANTESKQKEWAITIWCIFLFGMVWLCSLIGVCMVALWYLGQWD